MLACHPEAVFKFLLTTGKLTATSMATPYVHQHVRSWIAEGFGAIDVSQVSVVLPSDDLSLHLSLWPNWFLLSFGAAALHIIIFLGQRRAS